MGRTSFTKFKSKFKTEFYNRSLKSWLRDHAIKICLTHNVEKLVVAERFIRT